MGGCLQRFELRETKSRPCGGWSDGEGYLDADYVVLDPGFELLGQEALEDPQREEKRHDNALPPCEEHDGLEDQELGQGLDGLQLILRHGVELHEAVQGPRLAEVENDRQIRVAAYQKGRAHCFFFNLFFNQRPSELNSVLSDGKWAKKKKVMN